VRRRRLEQPFYRRDTLEVARDLLGRVLCRRLEDGTVIRGRLVEVEAYDGPHDRTSHAFPGLTERGYPAAILLRGAESPDGAGSASGPGRLTRAFGVDRSMDGTSLLGPDLWLEEGRPVADREVGRTARIGVGEASSWSRRRFRFLIRSHPDVSGPRALNRRAR